MAAGRPSGALGLTMKEAISGLDAATYKPHALHDLAQDWPETNCYTDLWIEVLQALGVAPQAMLGFTLRQDFEGDQFTFFKTPLEDLEELFGISVGELAIFDDLEKHIATQATRGRLVLVEVDAFFLPDTREVSYRSSHSKTTIGVNGIDLVAKRLTYFHNAGYFELEAEDYEGLFAMFRHARAGGHLFPYAEFAKIPANVRRPSRPLCEKILARHLKNRPELNPFRSWQKHIVAEVEDLRSRPEGYFHVYAFNTLRQAGANFALLATHLEWLDATGYSREVMAAKEISQNAKSMQFQLARALARRKTQALYESVTPMADAWDRLMLALESRSDIPQAA
jgi:hypothetical protein